MPNMTMATELDSEQHSSCIDLRADSSAAGLHVCNDGIHCSSDSHAEGSKAKQQRAASNGRLALLEWNDGHELVAQGMLDAAGFGGSAKEA
jgi:hypothetical protein